MTNKQQLHAVTSICHTKIKQLQAENAQLKKIIIQGLAVVEDFLPNIGQCVLQDYEQLNLFMVEAEKVKRFQCSTLPRKSSS